MRGGSVNKVANESATDKKKQTKKKLSLSHANDLQRVQFREERVLRVCECEIKSGGNTRDGSPSIVRSHLQSAFSLPPSFSKALRCAGFKARGRVEAFGNGFLKTNISSHSD